MDKLRKQGCDIVIRTAGSHGAFDCLGINLKDKTMKFIQAKPKSMGKKARARLEDEWKSLNDEFICSFEVI